MSGNASGLQQQIHKLDVIFSLHCHTRTAAPGGAALLSSTAVCVLCLSGGKTHACRQRYRVCQSKHGLRGRLSYHRVGSRCAPCLARGGPVDVRKVDSDVTAKRADDPTHASCNVERAQPRLCDLEHVRQPSLELSSPLRAALAVRSCRRRPCSFAVLLPLCRLGHQERFKVRCYLRSAPSGHKGNILEPGEAGVVQSVQGLRKRWERARIRVQWRTAFT